MKGSPERGLRLVWQIKEAGDRVDGGMKGSPERGLRRVMTIVTDYFTFREE